MKDLFNNIEQVSPETRKKISKIGTPALLKKYIQKNFVIEEEIVIARYFLLKRGIQESEIRNGDTFYLTYVFKKKDKELKQNAERSKSLKKQDDLKKSQSSIEQKKEKELVIILTELEYIMFERFIFLKKESVEHNAFEDLFPSNKKYKGVLGSLTKKNILIKDEDLVRIGDLGKQMISNQIGWRKKIGYERNCFSKPRKLVEVDGKKYEKSSYIRHLLKKNNNLNCKETNNILQKLGFSKLYYSEYKRCKDQLGIVSRDKQFDDKED